MKHLKKTFYFVRHGDAAYRGDSIFDDSHEVPLTSKGEKQAESIQKVIELLSIQTICVSPMKRAIDTMNIITKNLSCETVVIPELSECTHATWHKMVELENGPKSGSNCPHVCSFMERAVIGATKALEHPGPVLIVAHGGVHFAICHYMDIKEHDKKIGNCVPVHFFPEEENWKAKHLALPTE